MSPVEATTHADPVNVESDRALTRQLRERHRFMLGLAAVVIAFSFLLRFSETDSLRIPWVGAALPAMCSSRVLFGIECPGCGLTRSFVALASGDFSRSLQYNRVGWLLAFAVVAQFPYRALALRELNHRVVKRRWPAWFGGLLIAALIGNWVLKVIGV